MRGGWALWISLLAACQPPGDAGVQTHVDDWRDEIVYQIVVDRFDDGDPGNDVLEGIGPEPDDLARFQGGDWRGVRDRLDYLEALGVTTIWLSPPYANVQRTEGEDGYHGYWPSDFTEANPRFGTLEELRALVDDAHARGMLVILDVVPNHAGRVFTYDLDADGEVDDGEIEPPYADPPYTAPLLFSHAPRMWRRTGEAWERFALGPEHFHRRGFGDLSDQMQKELGDFPTGLRDLDTENPDVVDALVDTHVWWVAETDVDGFRIDAVPHASPAFWAAFDGRLRRRLAELGKRRFLLLGEVFVTRPEALAQYTALDQLDSAFAFDLKDRLINGVILEGRPPTEAVGALETNRVFFPASGQPEGIGVDPWAARAVFGDNHDVFRLRGELDDPLAVEIALTAVLTVDGIPVIYYGTEQGLDGTRHHLAREPLWRVAGFDPAHPMFQHIARLTALRRSSVALRRGTLEVRYAAASGGADEVPEEDAGVIAWERAHEAERLLVVLNASLDDSVADIPTGFREGVALFDALDATDAPWVVGERGVVRVRLPGRAGVVLRPE
mgnify:CR=1 FL=1